MKENLGQVTPASKNTFKDRHGRTLIGDAKNRRYYVVEKENERIMTVMENRFIIVFAVLVLIGFRFGWVWGIGIGAFVLIGFEIFYRKVFLSTLRTIDNVDVPKTHSSIYMVADEASEGKNILRCGASLLTTILLILNVNLTVKDWSEVLSFKDFNTSFMVIFSAIAAVVFMYFAIVSYQAIIRNRRKK